jgi:hypothetical protein
MLIRNRYTVKSFIDIPTVVVSVFWVAIWLLWLTVDDASYMYSEASSPCSVTFVDASIDDMNSYKSPAFAFSSLSSDTREDNIEVDKNVPARIVARSKLLGQPEKSANKQADGTSKHLGRSELVMRGYHAKWPKMDKGDKPVPVSLSPIHIEPSAELEEYGYYIPSYAIENVIGSNSAWEVTAHVELNKEGQTEHVFLLSLSADKGINSKVERMLSQGALYQTGQKSSGRVIISFGGEK